MLRRDSSSERPLSDPDLLPPATYDFSHAIQGEGHCQEKPIAKEAIFPLSRGRNRMPQGVENRGSLISVPLALRVMEPLFRSQVKKERRSSSKTLGWSLRWAKSRDTLVIKMITCNFFCFGELISRKLQLQLHSLIPSRIDSREM